MITGDLLPSSAMIKELSQEFGMPMSQGDLTEQKLLAVAPAPSLEAFQNWIKRKHKEQVQRIKRLQRRLR